MTSFEKDLAEISRRETHLWAIALLLLVTVVGVAAGAFYVLFSRSGGLDIVGRSIVMRALPALLVLILVFCGYVIHTRSSFSKIRNLFEAQALRDSLTGLFNRQSFPERIAQEMLRSKRNENLLGILLCDLDHFKHINDTYGHPKGDEVLQQVAKAVLGATRGTDMVFRWGGDEILAVLSPTERSGALTVGRRIREEVAKVKDETGCPVDLSIGVAFYPEHGQEVADLIQLADKALYIAKRSGDKLHVGEEELPLGEDAVKLVFQPVVHSSSRETLGYEILSRDPEGKVSIMELFRRYQAVGQLNDLKRRIFLQQIRETEKLGLPRVFINVDFDLLKSVEPVDKPPNAEIILEISEAETVRQVEKYLAVVESWREKGFLFAIDDFGAGFMSLPFVAQLLPAFIKMDRSAFVQAADSERFGGFLKDMISAMGNYSSQGIIAEGVETEEELEFVASLGVGKVQGHLTGRPAELEETEEKTAAGAAKS